ncbi:hypothetical protein SAMN05443663_102429 [Flavobacterium defluvii]|uniref:Uncharacterized protein n=1 Tax=Flavobacterium defluvii TaxID=370979 RepID=A0A1M5ILP2_9FLAO|nr:hypothetical protein SAMN05443663_102429 [Flavobacterium defluvii]
MLFFCSGLMKFYRKGAKVFRQVRKVFLQESFINAKLTKLYVKLCELCKKTFSFINLSAFAKNLCPLCVKKTQRLKFRHPKAINSKLKIINGRNAFAKLVSDLSVKVSTLKFSHFCLLTGSLSKIFG